MPGRCTPFTISNVPAMTTLSSGRLEGSNDDRSPEACQLCLEAWVDRWSGSHGPPVCRLLLIRENSSSNKFSGGLRSDRPKVFPNPAAGGAGERGVGEPLKIAPINAPPYEPAITMGIIRARNT
jgi:hypothetical protein